MKKLVASFALMLPLVSSFAGTEIPADLFAGKSLVAPHIYVEDNAQFANWNGKSIPQGDVDTGFFEKYRLGTVAFSPDLRVHVDVIRNKVNWPSYYQLVDARSGMVLGKYAVRTLDDAELYFSGTGAAYLNQEHMQLCGPRYTRKIQQKGKGLYEVEQPLIYIGAETMVDSTTPLYDSPNSRKVVATVAPKTRVMVLGVAPGKTATYEMALLVKTPFGLTGWHVQGGASAEGSLNIYQCN